MSRILVVDDDDQLRRALRINLAGLRDQAVRAEAAAARGVGPACENETNYLRVHVAKLRRKLEPDPSRPRYLITEPGVGYRFVP